MAKDLQERGIEAQYESLVLPFVPPTRKYKTDWVLPNGVIVEAKGYFTSEDRTKMLAVKAQHPTADIRLLFQAADRRLSKSSKTTYAQWADKHGFPWAETTVPQDWLE